MHRLAYPCISFGDKCQENTPEKHQCLVKTALRWSAFDLPLSTLLCLKPVCHCSSAISYGKLTRVPHTSTRGVCRPSFGTKSLLLPSDPAPTPPYKTEFAHRQRRDWPAGPQYPFSR